MFELRRAERWRRGWQGPVPTVHAALCGDAGGYSDEQQVEKQRNRGDKIKLLC